jgi:hypothetical protein
MMCIQSPGAVLMILGIALRCVFAHSSVNWCDVESGCVMPWFSQARNELD